MQSYVKNQGDAKVRWNGDFSWFLLKQSERKLFTKLYNHFTQTLHFFYKFFKRHLNWLRNVYRQSFKCPLKRLLASFHMCNTLPMI